MAIVKMSKLSCIGMKSEKAELLRELMDLGVLEIRDVAEKLSDEEWLKVSSRDGSEDEVSAIEEQISRTEAILSMIDRFDTAKKPLFATRDWITEEQYAKVMDREAAIKAEVSEFGALLDEWNELKNRKNSLQTKIASLEPWMDYSLPLNMDGTKNVRAFYGVIPALYNAEQLKNNVTEVSDATEVAIVSRDQEQQYLSVICMRADEAKIEDVLKGYGFSFGNFTDLDGTAKEIIAATKEEIAAIEEEEAKIEARFAEASAGEGSVKTDIRYYHDALVMDRDQAKAMQSLMKTKETFEFDCWMIDKNRSQVEDVLKKHDCWYEITQPEKDEETPVLLENNGIVTPFETVTDLYSLPSSKEIDPTGLFSAFYFIFFGMMFADMGYGLILAVVCFAALKMFKLEGLAYKLIKMLAFCGVSTFIWGALFGGFFGNIITVVSGNFFGKEILVKPLWFDPLSNPMKLLAFSCILGAVHLFLGMGVKAYLLIRDGQLMDAIEQIFVWYALLLGVALLLFGGSLFEGASSIGMVLAIIGAVGIVGIPVVRGKGIGKLIGLWNLYGATSYLGDVLSYSRLLALGLASAVIAQVFNALGGMLGKGPVAIIGFIVIAVVGHVFNFAINALGTFVHASRLQYVEFFGKFFEGGGVPFKPYQKNTKYVKIVKEDKK